MLISGDSYRESLRRYKPQVYVDGRKVESVADEAAFAPGVNAVALTYDFALREQFRPVMRTQVPAAGAQDVNRMMGIPANSQDLLNKLEAVRLVCQETGCAERYLGGDCLSAIWQSAHRVDAQMNTKYVPRVRAYLERVYAEDL